jgi:hypothetical protein
VNDNSSPYNPTEDAGQIDAREYENPQDSSIPDDQYEGAVPPGYDWPTHGGYLGCFIGLIVSCLIGGFLGSTFFATLRYYQLLPGVVAALLTVALYVALIAIIGRLGWVLGKRFYREYPQERGPTWGESDVVADRIERDRDVARRARRGDQVTQVDQPHPQEPEDTSPEAGSQ